MTWFTITLFHNRRFKSDVAGKLNRITKMKDIQLKDEALSDKAPLSIAAFLQDFKEEYNVCNIQEAVAMWLSNQYLIGPGEVDSISKTSV